MTYRIMLLFAVTMVTACTTLGPDYSEPKVDWLADWESSLYGQIHPPVSGMSERNQELEFWWLSFADPVLNELLKTARAENSSLRIAGLRILESRAVLGIAQGNRYPQAQRATGAVMHSDSWSTGSNASHSNLTSYDVGVNLGWELDFWGRFQRGIESADAAFFSSISNEKNAQVLLNALVAQTYFSYRTTARQIYIAKQNAALQKRSLEITEKLYTSGQSGELDVQQAKNQYLVTLSTIPKLEIGQQQLSNALGVLLGRPPGNMPELSALPNTLPALSKTMIQDLPARLLMRRPDVRTSAWQVAAQSAQIGLAEAQLYPSISLLGNIGWSGSSLGGNTNTLSTAVGPSFTWNLFNYGRIKNNIRVQDVRLQQAIESYQNTVLQAAREIDDAAIVVVKTLEQDAILQQSLAAAERSLTLSTSRYQEGYSDFQRVLDAQRSLATQSNKLVVNQGEHINAVIALYKALGGGWQPTSVEQIVPKKLRQQMEQRTDWGDQLEQPLPTLQE
ncbi:efflux transporter outer membrane subunit [Oceanisphaera pacifica]|uniref:efflux transporter outer membrane subunit n=1 Tax=Oceanisphaera pacifica TaxID=2818389 RepID=UPI00311CDDFF